MFYSLAISQVRVPRRKCIVAEQRSQRVLRRHLNAEQVAINLRDSWDAEFDRAAMKKIKRVLHSED